MKNSIVILTGAGISAESGVKTFRDSNGLWENHRVEDVATPEAFRRDPKTVYSFYNARRAQLNEVVPNAAHYALVKLQRNWKADVIVITQNVDDLHDRAETSALIHMHGELRKAWCLKCDGKMSWVDSMDEKSVCLKCHQSGGLRPDIVWFGEIPYHLDSIERALSDCACFVAIGTSGNVYPAAGLVSMVPKACKKIEINTEGTPVSNLFDDHRRGVASVEVSNWVNDLLQI